MEKRVICSHYGKGIFTMYALFILSLSPVSADAVTAEAESPIGGVKL